MKRSVWRPSEPLLLGELDTAEAAFASGMQWRLSAICWMAAIVAELRPGPVQEAAEDRLSALIARAELSMDELAWIRRLRSDGIHGQGWASGATLDRG
jgi:hypothetical protein